VVSMTPFSLTQKIELFFTAIAVSTKIKSFSVVSMKPLSQDLALFIDSTKSWLSCVLAIRKFAAYLKIF
jgi:hypothetical protein